MLFQRLKSCNLQFSNISFQSGCHLDERLCHRTENSATDACDGFFVAWWDGAQMRSTDQTIENVKIIPTFQINSTDFSVIIISSERTIKLVWKILFDEKTLECGYKDK